MLEGRLGTDNGDVASGCREWLLGGLLNSNSVVLGGRCLEGVALGVENP